MSAMGRIADELDRLKQQNQSLKAQVAELSKKLTEATDSEILCLRNDEKMRAQVEGLKKYLIDNCNCENHKAQDITDFCGYICDYCNVWEFLREEK